MHRRWRWLRRRWLLSLTPALEQQFQQDRRQAHVPLVIAAVATAFSLIGLYLLVDFLGARQLAHWPLVLPIVLMGALPGLAAVCVLLRKRRHGFPLWWVLVPAASNALCWAVLPAIGTRLGAPWPYEILMYNFLYTFFFLAIPVRIAIGVALAEASVFILLQLATAPHDWALFSQSYILVGFLVPSAVAAVLLERNERRAWLAQRRLAELARRDSLTGLCNRRSFFENSEAALRQARRTRAAVALLLIDADHFKQFNDSHGHPAGDVCLCRVAGVLRAAAQRPLDCAARIGGEEFAILFFDAPEPWALARAEEIREAIHRLEQKGLPGTTVSIGLASAGADVSLAQLLQRADTALYRAKSAGRNRVST